MFWNVYYVKGAFLNADASFEVLQGMRTLDVRMLRKCINTEILARFMAAHPQINVNSNALPDNENAALAQRLLHLGLPAPLFTADMGDLPRSPFQRFFDSLSPTFGHMISLGQSNTIVSCPSLTTHSELDEAALAKADLTPTTIRFAIGDESPLDLLGPSGKRCPNHDRSRRPRVLPGLPWREGAQPAGPRMLSRCAREVHRSSIAGATGSVS